jgi:integrase/recombinase XerD
MHPTVVGRRHSQRIIYYLTEEECKRLLGVITTQHDRAIFLFAYHHGLLASELGVLERTDLVLKQGQIAIHRLKDSLSAIYPMQPDMQKLLRAYLRSRTDDSPYLFISSRRMPIDPRTLWYLTDRYVDKAGLPAKEHKFYCLKHSIATHLPDAGADLSFVKDWLGHANTQNTTISASLTIGTRNAEMQTLRQYLTRLKHRNPVSIYDIPLPKPFGNSHKTSLRILWIAT